MAGLTTITVARRPMSEGSVAANAKKHGTGAIHIDAARIASVGEVISTHSQSKESANDDGKVFGKYAGDMETHQSESQKLGRWPNNLILVHHPDCVPIGTTTVGKGEGSREARDLGTVRHDGDESWRLKVGKQDAPRGYEGEQATQWDCTPTCPVSSIDRQSDVGASRYFKQLHGEGMSQDIPQDLLGYLHKLITPTHAGGETLVVLDLPSVNWSEYEDAQFAGLIARSPAGGDPGPYMDDIWRVVKPGAHVLLIAHDEEPTGHTGACALEDVGFEIRDAILVAQEAGHLHYVPKAPKKERHAGTGDLANKRKPESTYKVDDDGWTYLEDIQAALTEAGVPDEQIEGLEENGLPKSLIPPSVRDFFVRSEDDNKAPGGGNNHPTVKPKDVLVRLLEDVPKTTTVLDPFMGSGSMGIACLETGHSYIGIEKQAEYIELADVRIRHWDRSRTGWLAATIESEAPQVVEEAEDEMGLGDLFGF
ncbi:site-specific DNA-methyltransferase [Deltaproteobacteria bacterium]|nr:site-specific DNA-methyltransferase [Deltaproteobacteria bacterium]